VARQTCQVCGRRRTPATMKQHHVVPTEVTEEAGIAESQTLQMCADCHQEAHHWYQTKVARTTYDPGTKRFRPRTGLELVREYHATFSSFLNYKAEQRHQASRR